MCFLIIYIFIYMINFLSRTEILLLNMLKLLKKPGFSRFFSKFLKLQVFPGLFCLSCQTPGFSRIPGKVATLSILIFQNSFIKTSPVRNFQLILHTKIPKLTRYRRVLISSQWRHSSGNHWSVTCGRLARTTTSCSTTFFSACTNWILDCDWTVCWFSSLIGWRLLWAR